MRITAEIVTPNKPIWALEVLAYLPFDRDAEYPMDKIDQVKGIIVSYLKNTEYKKRNSIMKLGNTHIIREEKNVITVSTIHHDTIVLTIIFSADEPVSGTCAVCGCTETDACYNPYFGNCWWIGRRRILCSHCACTDIVNSVDTRHAERKINWRTKGCK